MSKARRVIFMLIAVVVFLLPSSDAAQAAKWIAPAGNYLWTVEGSFCQNGARIVAFNPFSNEPGFSERTSFSAYSTTAHGSETPQIIDSVPIGEALGTVNLLIEYHAQPLAWVIDEPYQTGVSYVYGKARLTWAPLPVGTTVAVKRTQAPGGFFVGNVTHCTV